MMPHNQDANPADRFGIKKMIGKPAQVCPPQVLIKNGEPSRMPSRLLDSVHQLIKEFIGQPLPGFLTVKVHDCPHVVPDVTVKQHTHGIHRPKAERNSSKVMPASGLRSSSASRRSASATPSSSSESTPGSEPSNSAARWARSESLKDIACTSTSFKVAISEIYLGIGPLQLLNALPHLHAG